MRLKDIINFQIVLDRRESVVIKKKKKKNHLEIRNRSSLLEIISFFINFPARKENRIVVDLNDRFFSF